MKQILLKICQKLSIVFLLPVLLPTMLMAQQTNITGEITDAVTGEPLVGATVTIKGTIQGSVADTDGKYTLTADEDAVLVFSFVGYMEEEIPVNGQTLINVSLSPGIEMLSEMVVVGYGVQQKSTLTGSVGTVTSESLTQRPAANTTELLQGQVAGLVSRQASGLPGEDAATLNIRGFGNPLVIIDGVESNFDQIDPNDIETISVLKDASAAVYGARAGNGVILITTKRGSDAPARITYHGSVSATQPTFLPRHVNAGQYAELLYEAGENPNDFGPPHMNYDPETNTLTNIVDGSLYQGVNWSDALYRDWTPQQQHNINASGGTQNIRYFVSAGFTDQASNFSSGDYNFNRYNIRSNVDADINDNLSVSVDFSYRNTILDKANFTLEDMYISLNTARPVYPVTNEADPDRAAYSGFLQRSPYYQIQKDFSGFVENNHNVLQGAVQLEYKIPFMEGLKATARLNYEELFSQNKDVFKPFNVWEYDAVAASNNEDPWILQGTENQNRIFVYSDRARELLPLVTLDYDRQLGEHKISGLLASETRTYTFTSLRGDRRDLLSFEAPFLRYASREGVDNTDNMNQTARTSFIGRVNYDYSGKYMIEFAMRADASAEYPPESRWGYFPSVSAGWRISEEGFLKDRFDALNSLKLRGSYGILGFDAISAFDYLTGYNITGDNYVFGNSPAPVISSAGLANPNITWETMQISNIGLDGVFWNGKISFEVDVFYRLRENILAQPITQVPGTFGAQLPRTNLNKRDNRGFEVSLTHKNQIGEVSYNITPRFSMTRGKFVEWEENILPITDDMDEETREFNRLWNNRYVNEGQWDDRYWGYITDGFFMNQDQIDNHPVDQDQAGNQTLTVGDLIYKDINNDGIIDWRDQQVIGKSGLPKSMYSLDMGFSFKGLAVQMLWQGGAGYTVTPAAAASMPFHNNSIPIVPHYEHRAIIDYDADGNAFIANEGDFELPPVNQNSRTPNNAMSSDFWTFDAMFLRLRNINISYSLPANLINTVGAQSLTLYLSGSNLLAFSNLGIWKDSFDPEVINPTNREYPPVKTISFGVKLGL